MHSQDYRVLTTSRTLPCIFRVCVEQTDLLILARQDIRVEAFKAVQRLRGQIKAWIASHPEFLSSLAPLPVDHTAPAIVQDMLRASTRAGVGPMAAVAGAMARHVGEALLPLSPELVIENGGDIFMHCSSPQTFGILAESSEAALVAIRVEESRPGSGMGVCTSSGRLGHSLSLGKADAVTVLAEDPCFADALVTALANEVQGQADINRVLQMGLELGATGVVVIVDNTIGAAGKIVFVE